MNDGLRQLRSSVVANHADNVTQVELLYESLSTQLACLKQQLLAKQHASHQSTLSQIDNLLNSQGVCANNSGSGSLTNNNSTGDISNRNEQTNYSTSFVAPGTVCFTTGTNSNRLQKCNISRDSMDGDGDNDIEMGLKEQNPAADTHTDKTEKQKNAMTFSFVRKHEENSKNNGKQSKPWVFTNSKRSKGVKSEGAEFGCKQSQYAHATGVTAKSANAAKSANNTHNKIPPVGVMGASMKEHDALKKDEIDSVAAEVSLPPARRRRKLAVHGAGPDRCRQESSHATHGSTSGCGSDFFGESSGPDETPTQTRLNREQIERIVERVLAEDGRLGRLGDKIVLINNGNDMSIVLNNQHHSAIDNSNFTNLVNSNMEVGNHDNVRQFGPNHPAARPWTEVVEAMANLDNRENLDNLDNLENSENVGNRMNEAEVDDKPKWNGQDWTNDDGFFDSPLWQEQKSKNNNSNNNSNFNNNNNNNNNDNNNNLKKN